jgi:hypothetical protein
MIVIAKQLRKAEPEWQNRVYYSRAFFRDVIKFKKNLYQKWTKNGELPAFWIKLLTKFDKNK